MTQCVAGLEATKTLDTHQPFLFYVISLSAVLTWWRRESSGIARSASRDSFGSERFDVVAHHLYVHALISDIATWDRAVVHADTLAAACARE